MIECFNTRFPDYARGNIYTTEVTSYTASENIYVICYVYTGSDKGLAVDGNTVTVTQTISGTSPRQQFSSFCGFVKKGSVLTPVNESSIPLNWIKIFGLKTIS